jgi:hypothetical protein
LINILTQDILPLPKFYSEDLRKLVELLLQKDPNQRPNINDILSFNFVAEKMKLYNCIISPQNEIKKNFSSKGMMSQSNSNTNSNSTLNSNSTNYNSNSNNVNFNSISSPVNNLNNVNLTNPNNEYDMKSNLFNIGDANLLNEIDEVDEEQNANSNSISMSPRIVEKNLSSNKQDNMYHDTDHSHEIKIIPLIMNKHKKNSPSCFVLKGENGVLNNMNFKKIEITKHIKINEEIEDNISNNSPNNTNFSKKTEAKNKNKFFEQDLNNVEFTLESPEKGKKYLILDNKGFKKQRTKSLFSENLHSDLNKNQFISNKISVSKPSNSELKYVGKGNSVHSIIVKHHQNNMNKISASPNISCSTCSTNSNSSNANPPNNSSRGNIIAQSACKFKTYKEFSAKKLKPISINFTSVESPDHKAIYIKENEFNIDLKPLKSENSITIEANSNSSGRNVYNTYQTDSTNNSEIKKNYSSFYSSNTAVSFLVQQFGESKVDQLLNLIEKSSNLIELLNGDGKEIKKIVGDKYQTAQNLLKRVVSTKNSPQIQRKYLNY